MAAAGLVERSKRILQGAFVRSVLPALGPAGLSVCWNSQSGARRYLLTDDVVNLRRFQHNKLKTSYKVYGRKDLYFRSIEDKLTKNSPILQEELKLLIHLCDSKSDVEIVKRVIYRYHEDNKNTITKVYKFGPLFMRLCYELNLEEPALTLIKDQALYGFFSDSTSFDVLMDLLFTNGNYEGALEVLLEMKKQGIKFSRGTYLLAIAICYKLNDSESCKICTMLLEDKQLRDNYLSRRAYYFLVALALKQNDLGKAHTFFSRIMDTDSRIYNNIKILLQAASDDLEDLVQTLEEASRTTASPFMKKTEFCSHVLNTAREKLEDVPTLCGRFEKAFTRLQSSGQIISSTLDDLLCQVPRKKRQPMQPLKPNIVSHRTQASVLLDE